MFNSVPSLRSRLTRVFGLLVVALTLAMMVPMTLLSTQRMQSDVAGQLEIVARHLGHNLDTVMSERYQDVRIVAGMIEPHLEAGNMAAVERLIHRMQTMAPSYAWIGFTDADGRVVEASGGLLEGHDVSGRPWFREALKGPFVGDVHDALLLADLLGGSGPDAKPLRFVDVAAPIRNEDGRLLGVLGAHLFWQWAADMQEQLRGQGTLSDDTEILIVSDSNRVLLGPEELLGQELQWQPMQDVRPGESGSFVAAGESGADYLVGYGATSGQGPYPGLGWKALARQPLDQALAGMTTFRNWSLGLSVLVAGLFLILVWLIARRTSHPLLYIAAQARDVEQGKRDAISPQDEFLEVSSLSRSLQSLMASLKARETELLELNRSLDERVQERTGELEVVNRELQSEIEMRADMQEEREGLIQRLRQMAHTDALTGVCNRRHFFELARESMRRSSRHGRPVSLILFDIDHFKQINDTHSHAAGDEVLKRLAHTVSGALRDVDVLARIGGEEFVILLESAPLADAEEAAERVRRLIEQDCIAYEGVEINITASMGVATWLGEEETLDQLLHRADLCLYAAKQAQRNRVEVDAREPG